MPVPQEQRQIGQAPLPDARITATPTPQTFGAGVAAVGERLGLQLFQKATQEANETAVLDADNQLARKSMDIQTQMQQLRGKDAMGAPDFVDEQMGNAAEDIAKGLANDQQRFVFQQKAVHRTLALQSVAHQHMAGESQAYQDGVTSDAIKNSIDNARMNARDPDIIRTEKASQTLAIAQWADRNGLIGSPQYQQRVAQAHSATNTEVIKGLLTNGHDLEASDYYKQNKTEFTAGDRDTVERLLDEGSTRGEAQTKAREIIASSDGELATAQKQYEAINDPKVQQLTRQLVHQHFDDLAVAKRRALDDNYQAITNVVDNQIKRNPGVSFVARDVIPPDYWTKLSLGERAAVQNYIEQETKPEEGTNDDAKWLKFLELSTDAKGAMGARDYNTNYRQYFSKSFRTRADGIWEASRNAVNTKDAKDPNVTDAVSAQHQIFETFRTSGLVDPKIERGQYNNDQVGTVVRFENAATAALEQESRSLKRKLTPIERQKVIDGVRDEAIKQVWVPGTFFGTNQKAMINMTEEEKGQAIVPIDKIPADDAAQLKAYLQSIGKPITADKLRRAYPQWKLFRNRQAFDAIMNE